MAPQNHVIGQKSKRSEDSGWPSLVSHANPAHQRKLELHESDQNGKDWSQVHRQKNWGHSRKQDQNRNGLLNDVGGFSAIKNDEGVKSGGEGPNIQTGFGPPGMGGKAQRLFSPPGMQGRDFPPLNPGSMQHNHMDITGTGMQSRPVAHSRYNPPDYSGMMMAHSGTNNSDMGMGPNSGMGMGMGHSDSVMGMGPSGSHQYDYYHQVYRAMGHAPQEPQFGVLRQQIPMQGVNMPRPFMRGGYAPHNPVLRSARARGTVNVDQFGRPMPSEMKYRNSERQLVPNSAKLQGHIPFPVAYSHSAGDMSHSHSGGDVSHSRSAGDVREPRGQLVLMRGLPGSGKTTLARYSSCILLSISLYTIL